MISVGGHSAHLLKVGLGEDADHAAGGYGLPPTAVASNVP